MPGRTRGLDRTVAVALAAVIVVAVVLAIPGDRVVSTDRRASTTRSSASGVRALYLALGELGVPVARRLTPLVDADSLPRALALLEPTEPLSPREVGALVAEVRAGATLLYAPSPGDPLLDTLGLGLRAWFQVARRDDVPFGDLLTAPGSSLMSVESVPDGVWDVGVRPHPWTTGMEEPAAFRRALVPGDSVLPGLRPLLADGDTLLFALIVPLGAGRVVALSDAAPLTNAWIGTSGVAPLVVRAARDVATPDAPLVFDEFHHGFRGGSIREGVAAFLGGHPAGRTLLQLGTVLLVGVLAAGLRFGEPRSTPAARRSPLEHVDALARAYRESRAVRIPRLLLLSGLARHARRPRPHDETEARALLQRLRRAVPGARDALDRLEGSLEADDDLVATGAAVDRVAEELRR